MQRIMSTWLLCVPHLPGSAPALHTEYQPVPSSAAHGSGGHGSPHPYGWQLHTVRFAIAGLFYIVGIHYQPAVFYSCVTGVCDDDVRLEPIDHSPDTIVIYRVTRCIWCSANSSSSLASTSFKYSSSERVYVEHFFPGWPNDLRNAIADKLVVSDSHLINLLFQHFLPL